MTQDVTEPGDLRGTAVRSVAWVALQKWGNRLSGLVVFTVLGRLLDPAELGLAALATIFIAFFQVLADQGFSSALIQAHELDSRDRDTAFWTSVGAAVGLVGLTVGLSPLAGRLLHQPHLGVVLWGLSPMLLMSALASVPESMLQREFRFRSLTLRTLLASVTGGAVGVVCAVFGAGVWSVVVQALVTSFVSVVFLWSVTEWRPAFHYSRDSLRKLRATGLSVLGIQLVGLVNSEGDQLIVGAFLGPTALGYYFVGARIVTILLDIQTSVIESISLTTLSRLQHNRERLRNAFYSLTTMGAAVAIVTFGLVAGTADVLLPLVFGPHWRPAVHVMQILCLMGALNAIIVFDRNALIASGAARAALMITVVQCAVGLVAIGIAVKFGVLAVAIAVAVRQYVVWPFRLKKVRDALGISIRRYVLNWAGPMTSGLIVFALTLAAGQWLHAAGRAPAEQVLFLAVAGAVGVTLYAVTLRFTSPRAFGEMRALAALGRANLPIGGRRADRRRNSSQ